MTSDRGTVTRKNKYLLATGNRALSTGIFMVISWYGEGCFKIQNGEDVILVDPPEASSGISAPRFKSNLLIKSITPWPVPENLYQASDFSIIGAGEYDHNGVKIKGYNLIKESSDKYFKSVYVVSWDDITLGILGHVSSELSPEIMENLEEIDVLIGPAGGSPFLGQMEMSKLVKQLNPKIFIPSFYKIEGLKRKSLDVKDFLANFNGEVSKDNDKFTFKRKDIEGLKKTKVICLKV